MGPLAKFLLALTNLVRSGIIKKLPDAIKIAEREFGRVTPLLKKQIEKVFEKAKKPVVGKPGKKEGTILPFVRDAKKTESAEGIETLDEFNLTEDDPMGDLEKIVKGEGDTGLPKDTPKVDSKENIMGAIDKLKNPRRPGGPLDPAMGVTRTLARRVLEKRGIKIDRREDPIDIFINTFGEAITDLKNLGDEIVEAEQIGRNLKPMDDLLQIEGFFDMEVPEDPFTGIPNEDVIEQLEKDLKEKEILEDFDPTDRDPNAKGGLAGIINL